MSSRITINGQQYDSPDAMPPEVRRQYDQALQALGSAMAAKNGTRTTRIASGSSGSGVHSEIVVHTQTYHSGSPMPPELCPFVEPGLHAPEAKDGGATKPALTMNVQRPTLNVTLDSKSPTRSWDTNMSAPDMKDKAQAFVFDLAFWVAVALGIWALMSR